MSIKDKIDTDVVISLSNEIAIQKSSFEKGRQLAAEAISGTIATVKDMLDLK